MPAVQDLNRPSAATINPFEELPNHVNEFTATEIATLQSRLDKQLGPEYISTRPGAGGGKVHYLAAEKVINLANEVFGFNGWSSQIQKVEIDFVDEKEGNRITLGLAIIVRVTLRDGTFHEDMGYGHIENCKGKAAAFEKARKEAATDALKRALRNFGKVLGNCLYDKDYLSRVTKVKVQPSRWDETNLHRHADYAPLKKEPIRNVSDGSMAYETPGAATNGIGHRTESHEMEDDFGGGALFDGVDMSPNEVALHEEAQAIPPQILAARRRSGLPPEQQQPSHTSRPPGPQQYVPIPPNGYAPGQPSANGPPDQIQRAPQPPPPTTRQSTYSTPPNPITDISNQAPPHQEPASSTDSAYTTIAPPTGFLSSRAIIRSNPNPKDESLTDTVLAHCTRFDPNAESPSIPKTSGVNHSVSRPVKSAAVGVTQPPLPVANATSPMQMPAPASRGGGRNFVNPAMDPSRRIGVVAGGGAGGAGSPSANRSSFKQPGPATAGVKRPLPVEALAGPGARPRTPLTDVSNVPGVNGTVPFVNGGGATDGAAQAGVGAKVEMIAGQNGASDESVKRMKTAT